MNCPDCGLEMTAGVLQSGGSRGGSIMFWAKEKRLLRIRPDKGDVRIANKALSGSNFPAWICSACQLVLFNYKENDE